MTCAVNKSTFLIFFLTFFLVNICSAEILVKKEELPKNEELQFSNNTNLQAYLEKSFQLKFQEETFNFSPKDFSVWKTSFSFHEDYSSEIERSSLCQDEIPIIFVQKDSFVYEPFSICDLTHTISSVGHFKKGASLEIDRQKIEEYVSTLSEEIVSAPKNAKIRMIVEPTEELENKNQIISKNAEEKESKVKTKMEILIPAQSGFSLDEEGTIEIIASALKNPKKETVFQLPTKKESPKISKETLGELKITEQIGHGESNFAGSPKNRIHNINVAVEKFDGLILEPGEEFSFVTILGPVEKETGYKEELVIKENKTIPEYGGGICQVSTTVFRAALNTGLKITERQNHAYPVQYYSPQGTDATIYIPKPDLRFMNNTSGFVLFQVTIEGRKLIFDIFGESDGRQVEMEGPRVTERTPEGILKVTLKQIVKDKDGGLMFEDTFKSVYDNPDKYHEVEILKTKPTNWSNKQWKNYRREHNL